MKEEQVMAKLSNKVAVVTGASKGIGASIAKHLAAEGASVVVNYSSSPVAAAKVVEEIVAAGGKALAVKADVSKATDVKALFDATEKAPASEKISDSSPPKIVSKHLTGRIPPKWRNGK